MGAVEVNVSSSVCRRCGIAYSRLKGYFPVCYSSLYKGTGYLPYCRTCVDALLADYYVVTKDYKSALRQVCRKLDLYWSDDLYEQTARQTSTRSLMTNYITRSNGIKYVGKSYDDTLEEEGTLWVWDSIQNENAHKDMEPPEESVQEEPETVEEPEEIIEIAEETMMFWGPGYTNKVYHELEQRFQYYKAQMNDVQMDVGTEALLRQIVMLEIDINKARAEGKQVDKMVNALNTLLGSAALKPAQKKRILTPLFLIPHLEFGLSVGRMNVPFLILILN